MKIVHVIIAAAVVAGCVSCGQGVRFVPHVEYGAVSQMGQGFSLVEMRTENPPDFVEKYRLSCEFRFRDIRVDETCSVSISPSGRYALYESKEHGGIVVFDTQANKKLRVRKRGTAPSVKGWSSDEKLFIVQYYDSRNNIETVKLQMDSLDVLGEK